MMDIMTADPNSSAIVRFRFDDRELTARANISIAAALTEHGIRAQRQTPSGDERGMFCGMGVCQDCLVVVDGKPSQRACMTQLTEGMDIRTHPALAPIGQSGAAPAATELSARRLAPDVLVVGGGAGGLAAAAAAARAGAKVLLLDERKVSGGQYFKQPGTGFEALDAQQSDGHLLLNSARNAGVEIISEAEIWGAFDGPLVIAQQQETALVIRPRQLIVATGAYERPVMVPGWTLPGVVTTGAAQTLWRSYRAVAGKRIAICGSGPLNLQVARELAAAGAEVKMVAESASPPWLRPIRAAQLALHDPLLAAKGMAMLATLYRKSVPVRFATRLTHVESAQDGGLVAYFMQGQTKTVLTVDAVCMNAGFDPQNEIPRLLGAQMYYDPEFGHLRTWRDPQMRSTVPGLWVVGDCAGLGGAPAALVEGQIAGRGAAAAAGFGCDYDNFLQVRALKRHRRFQKALWRVYAPLPELPTDPATIICRCENVTLADIQAGMSGAAHIGTMKRATRAGMGRCQGRYCSPVAVRLMAKATGQSPRETSFFAPRVPVKPVSIRAVMTAEEVLNETD